MTHIIDLTKTFVKLCVYQEKDTKNKNIKHINNIYPFKLNAL